MFRDLFLHPRFADDVGLVAVGGDLRPERLLLAYRRGVFPCFGEHDPVCWWSPDPRGIFELDGLHLSRRLVRTLRGGRFTVTVNRDFAGVIAGCVSPFASNVRKTCSANLLASPYGKKLE